MKLKECKDKKLLFEYLTEKGNNHQHYKKYSSYITESYINGYIELSSGCNWDDKEDYDHICGTKEKIFATCFCCQTTENYSLYKTYCSNNKKLQMLDLTKKDLKNIIYNEDTTIELIDCDGSCTTLDKSVKPELIDVVYIGKRSNKDTTIFTHKSEYEELPLEIIKGNEYLTKKYFYYNEQECRLLIRVSRDKYDKYKKARINFPKELINAKNVYVWDNKDNKYNTSTVGMNYRECCNKNSCYKEKRDA